MRTEMIGYSHGNWCFCLVIKNNPKLTGLSSLRYEYEWIKRINFSNFNDLKFKKK